MSPKERRTHKKSRLGCAECKKRHIRCDETRPSCVNCQAGKRQCPYVQDQTRQSSPQEDAVGNHADSYNTPRSRLLTPSTSHLSQHSPCPEGPSNHPSPLDHESCSQVACQDTPRLEPSNTFELPPNVQANSSLPSVNLPESAEKFELPPNVQANGFLPSVNLVHHVLFHHFQMQGCKSLVPPEQLETYRRAITTYALQHTFLMCETLAFAAYHMAYLASNDQEHIHYHELSTSLQSEGLQAFQEALPTLGNDNCPAFMLFSHLIGVHSFCGSITTRDDSIGSFLSRLSQTISLLRGVRSIISPYWSALLTSEIGPVMLHSSNVLSDVDTGPATDQLIALLQEQDLSEKTYQKYVAAVRRLQVQLNSSFEAQGIGTSNSTYAAFTWLITTPADFGELLDERRPEALAILAWYAVILDKHAESWIIGRSGRYIFDLIESYLGSRWAAWLEWPRAQLQH